MRKINAADEGYVRNKVLAGATKISNLCGMTLGPNGRSVIIERGMGEPLIVDDGRRVAENMKLDDPIEHLVTRAIYAVTRKTDEKVGDGTTTATVLTHAIVDEIARNHIPIEGGIGINANVADVDRELHEARDTVLKRLDELAQPVETKEQLVNVATISANDAKLGQIIGDMYHTLGKDGHITLEFDLLSEEVSYETVPGYRFSGGYAAPWMLSDAVRKVCSVDDVNVLVLNKKVLDINDILPAANVVSSSGKNRLVVIAQRFDKSVLKIAFENATRQKNPFYLLLVRAPSRGEEAYKDLGIFTGGKCFTENHTMQGILPTDLGHVRRIEATDDTCILIEGAGKKEDIDKRIEEVRGEENVTKLPQFKKDREERISALSGGVGLIKIGAPTDEERNFIKEKLQDAVQATKHAYREGVVKGGGITYSNIAEQLPEGNILKKVLWAPYERLVANAGGTFEVGDDVLDPVAVAKSALINAVSAASKLIRIGGAIAFSPKPTLEEAFKGVFPKQQGDPDYGVEDDVE